MIVRPLEHFDGGAPDAKTLYSCVSEHFRSCGRYRLLNDYYSGRHAINRRTRTQGLPNNALVHAFPRYITTVTSGYLAGSPINYTSDKNIDALKKALKKSDIDSVDSELARSAAIYGKGIEYIYSDTLGNVRSCALSVHDAFVVYSDTVDQRPLFGVRAARSVKNDGTTGPYSIEVATSDHVFTFVMNEISTAGFEKISGIQRHFFGTVPMIEYWNNDDETGDFECALSLIDAYDLLESDRINDKQQFVDALLVIYGCTLETDENGRSPGRQLREDKALALPDPSSKVEWLSKQLNENDTQVLAKAINADIHKMCMVPDMTDEMFSGNSSGVAMRYKLLGLEQLTHIKERWFKEGLRQRVRAYCRYLSLSGACDTDPDDIGFSFTRSLPVNEYETAQTVSALKGIVSGEALEKKALSAIG